MRPTTPPRPAARNLRSTPSSPARSGICPDLLGPGWLERHGLQPLVDQPLLVEQLWLLLPEGAANGSAARDSIRALRRQLSQGDSRHDAQA